MGNGYIKLHRELFDHPIWKQSTPEQKVILIALMGMANHEPNRWEWNGQIFEVERGQFVTSLESIRDVCGKGISIKNIRTALARFEKLGFLANKSTKQGRLITIEKYTKWQGDGKETGKATGKEVAKRWQTGGKGVATNKNDKNDKNDKNMYKSVPLEVKDSFMAWANMRKQIKKPITTEETVTRALNKLKKLSSDPEEQNEIIQQAINGCWVSFYPLKDKPKKINYYHAEEEPEAEEMPPEVRANIEKMMKGFEV